MSIVYVYFVVELHFDPAGFTFSRRGRPFRYDVSAIVSDALFIFAFVGSYAIR